ncbi:SubName: Full=Related to endoglucanase B {ECO:0000313/EMBL:CCA66803.1} [Serendipita indica DSM 11827]|nr:SubName: Full=Related to endoglucanase B {ECO:0000313/EMBL:CCA66803.1} [Serendipita indica DSM 11827]
MLTRNSIQIGSNWYTGWDGTPLQLLLVLFAELPKTLGSSPTHPLLRLLAPRSLLLLGAPFKFIGTLGLINTIGYLVANNFTASVTIPSKLAAGEYLLRHELLALHGATSVGGAQFYPVYIQLIVTRGGSASPSDLAFPGAYSATDPGIYFNPFQGDAANQKYVGPGGPVHQF